MGAVIAEIGFVELDFESEEDAAVRQPQASTAIENVAFNQRASYNALIATIRQEIRLRGGTLPLQEDSA